MPLTQEQFKKARDSGFTTEQIISFEKRRSAEASVESPVIPESKPFIGDLLPKFSATANVGDQTTITPTDIVAGTMPLKGMKALTIGLASRAKSVLGTEKLSNEPIMPKTGLLPISPVNIGAMTGARAATPRAVAEEAIDIASAPETYMGIEALRPGIISKPLQGLATKVESILPKAAEDVAPGIGQKGLSILKQGKNYLYDKVAKPISEMVSKNIKTNPEIGKALGLKDETIELLKLHGYDKVADPKLADEAASSAFEEAMGKKTSVYGDKIDIRDTLDLMKKKFTAIKKVDPNNPLGRIIENIKKLRATPKGEFYAKDGILPTPTQLGRHLKSENLTDIAGEVRITRKELSSLRDQLNNLYKDRSFDREVFDIVDSLYADAEKSGLEGIQNARKLFKEARQFEKVSTNLSKIEKLDSVKVHSDLHSVVNDPTKYQGMVDKYSKYVGKDVAKKIFDEALSVRRGGKILKRTGIYGGGALAGKGLFDIFR